MTLLNLAFSSDEGSSSSSKDFEVPKPQPPSPKPPSYQSSKGPRPIPARRPMRASTLNRPNPVLRGARPHPQPNRTSNENPKPKPTVVFDSDSESGYDSDYSNDSYDFTKPQTVQPSPKPISNRSQVNHPEPPHPPPKVSNANIPANKSAPQIQPPLAQVPKSTIVLQPKQKSQTTNSDEDNDEYFESSGGPSGYYYDSDDSNHQKVIDENINQPKVIDENINTVVPEFVQPEPPIEVHRETPKPQEPKPISQSPQKITRAFSENSDSIFKPISSGRIYRIVRVKKPFNHNMYELHEGDRCLMVAESNKSYIFFQVGDVYRPTEEVCAVLTIMNRKHNYSLTKENLSGTEILSITVKQVKEPLYYNRFFVVKMNGHDVVQPDQIRAPYSALTLETMMPKKNADGKYTINFKGKFTKQSIKNMVLTDKNESRVVTVRRIINEALEVEANSPVQSILHIFAIGVISWICPY